MKNNAYLATKWNELVNDSNALGDTKEVYNMLMSHFNQSHRSYHNANHIEHCVKEIDTALHLTNYPNEVRFALWFHDAIYNTRKKDNEDLSAKMAYDCLIRIGLNDEFASRSEKLVLATKHSALPEGIDAQLVVDVDLAILGAPITLFDKYEISIRAEYSWVPIEQFRKGRLDVLKSFLDRSNIYSTSFFQDKYESNARTNLKSSINKIQTEIES